MMDNNPASLPRPQYKPLRLPDGTLVARYDPIRGILEVKYDGSKYYFDLAVMYNAGHERPLYEWKHQGETTAA